MKTFLSAGTLLLLTLTLASCGDPAREAMQNYLQTAEPIAAELAETGGKFETLMNVQSDPLKPTDAEKTEIQAIIASMQGLEDRAAALAPPADLADSHPLLTQSIRQLKEAMQGVAAMGTDPAMANEATLGEITVKVEEAIAKADAYVEQTQAVIAEKYPDMLEE